MRQVISAFVEHKLHGGCLAASLLVYELVPGLQLRAGYKFYERTQSCLGHVWLVTADGTVLDPGSRIMEELHAFDRGPVSLLAGPRGQVMADLSEEMIMIVRLAAEGKQQLYWNMAPENIRTIRELLQLAHREPRITV